MHIERFEEHQKMEPTREILIGISDKLNQLKTVDEFHQSIQILQGENQKLAE